MELLFDKSWLASITERATTYDALVPGIEQAPGGQRLSNRHSLLLATRNAPNRGVSDERAPHMPQPEHRADHVCDHLVELFTTLVFDAVPWRTRLGRELERLFYGERRKVHVVLRAILHVSAIVRFDLGWREGVVVDVALNRVELMPLISEHAKECAATSTWTAKHDWKTAD